MKHLKRFFESNNSDADVLKEYFFNITDDLDNICEFEINQNNDNYFTVKIRPKIKVASKITQDSTNLLNDWLTLSNNDCKIIEELKSSISRLADEDILESFTLRKFLSLSGSEGYMLEIYTKLKNDQETEKWIFVEDDNSAWIDELRLKRYMMSKLEVELKKFELEEDYDKYNERYIQLTLHFSQPVQKSKLEEIKAALLEKEVTNEWEESTFKIFTQCHYPHYRDTSNHIIFELNRRVHHIQ